MSTAIVGAGAAGLSLALMLDDDVTVYEREAVPGGLCRSTITDGFTFDLGPHILGGIPTAVDWVVRTTGLEWVEQMTRNVGWVDGRFVRHPFEDDTIGLSYMRKMWKTDPAQLSAGGLSAQAGRKPGGETRFRYPTRGGYQAITDAWARQVATKHRLVLDHRAPVPAGYDQVISTAPIPGARYNRLAVVTLAFEGTAPDLTAIYLPEPWTPFHRLSFPSAFAPGNAPAGWFTVQGEASMSQLDYPIEDAWVLALFRTVAELGIANPPARIVDFRHAPYAYPVPVGTPDIPGIRHGRTGAHRYLNVDGVVAAGMILAAELNAAYSTTHN